MQKENIVGINPVMEALKAGRPIQRILIAEQRKQDRDVQRILGLAREAGIEVRVVARDALTREAPGAVHQGCWPSQRPEATPRSMISCRYLRKRGGSPLSRPDGVEDPRNSGGDPEDRRNRRRPRGRHPERRAPASPSPLPSRQRGAGIRAGGQSGEHCPYS